MFSELYTGCICFLLLTRNSLLRNPDDERVQVQVRHGFFGVFLPLSTAPTTFSRTAPGRPRPSRLVRSKRDASLLAMNLRSLMLLDNLIDHRPHEKLSTRGQGAGTKAGVNWNENVKQKRLMHRRLHHLIFGSKSLECHNIGEAHGKQSLEFQLLFFFLYAFPSLESSCPAVYRASDYSHINLFAWKKLSNVKSKIKKTSQDIPRSEKSKSSGVESKQAFEQVLHQKSNPAWNPYMNDQLIMVLIRYK